MALEMRTPASGETGERESDQLGRRISAQHSPSIKQAQGDLIAVVSKSRREAIHVTAREYAGVRKLHLQVHEIDRFGEWRATPKQLGIRREVLTPLIEALRRAREVLG